MSKFDETGLYVDRFPEVFAALVEDIRALWGEQTKDTPDSTIGSLLTLIAEAIADQNELIEGVGQGFNPYGAAGVYLSQLVTINGIKRKTSVNSSVALQVTADTTGTKIFKDDLVSDPDNPDDQYAIDTDHELTPSEVKLVSAKATAPGDKLAEPGTLTKIDTPRYGWVSVTNPDAAIPGRLRENDTRLRRRREVAAAGAGSNNVPAIYTAIADIDGVEALVVVQNKGTVTNPDGVPPQHIWAVVLGGADDEIAKAIFTKTGGGIGMYGSVIIPYDDPITGKIYDINFDRPDDLETWIDVEIVKDDNYPADGDSQIKQNLVDYWAGTFEVIRDGAVTTYKGFSIGDDVIYSRLYTPLNEVPGHSVTSLKIGFTDPPLVEGNLPVATDERSVVTVPRIKVNGS